MYAALCDALDGTAPAPPGGARKKGPGGVDFVSAMTGLFRELAVAAEQDEKVCGARSGRGGAGVLVAAPRLCMHAASCVPGRAPHSHLSRPFTLPHRAQPQELAATFGPAAIADVVLAVQAECDAQGLRMLQRFLEARHVAATAADAARHQSGIGATRAEGPDPRWARARAAGPGQAAAAAPTHKCATQPPLRRPQAGGMRASTAPSTPPAPRPARAPQGRGAAGAGDRPADPAV
jgi:hypothetical protein